MNSQPVSPKKLRDVLNGVCGSKAGDWQFPNSNKSQGYIENTGCYISYDQPNPEQWHVSFTAVNSESSS